MAYYLTKNELYHYGIKGQKRGLRRFQNEDGSLTEEGRRRYGVLERKILKQQAKINKYAKKYDNQRNKLARSAAKSNRANRLQARAAKLHNKAINGWLLSDKKRTNLELKSQRLSAKAAKLSAKANDMTNKANRAAAKIRRAQSLINKYSDKIAKIDPQSTYATHQFINGVYTKKLSDI